MSLLKKLAGETAIYGISSILSRVLHFVLLTPLLTRVFERTEYGIITLLFTYAAILMVLYTYRMETAFFRFGSKDGQLDKAFSTAAVSLLFTTGIFTLSFLLLLEPLSHFLNYPTHPEYIWMVVIIIALDALSAIAFARLRLENRPIRFAIIRTGGTLVNLLLVLFFLMAAPKLVEGGWTDLFGWYSEEMRITYVFFSNLVASAFMLIMLSPYFLKTKLQFDRGLWKKMMWYAAPLIVAGFAAVINSLIANPMLEARLPGTLEGNRAVVGVFGAAAKIAVLMNLFTQAFNYAAEPFFFRNADRSDARQIYAQVAQGFAIVASFAFLAILLYLDLVQYILGRDFRGGMNIIPILLLANLFLGLYYNFSVWFKLKDKTTYGAFISSGGVLITIAINYFFIPTYGYFAPAWAALACYLFMAAASYWTGRQHYPIAYPLGRIATYILLAVGLYFLSQFMRGWWPDQLLPILVVNTLLLGLYVLVIYQLEKNHLLVSWQSDGA